MSHLHLRAGASVASRSSAKQSHTYEADCFAARKMRLAMTKGREIKLSRISFQRGAKRDFHHKNYYKIYII